MTDMDGWQWLEWVLTWFTPCALAMAGSILADYAASSDLTVTSLHSLAASSSLTSGWTSGTIDNSTNEYLDYKITAKFTMHASNQQAGEIRVYAYAMQDDANWPDLFSSGTEGTQGTATVHDSEQLDSGMVLLWSTAVDGGASEVHTMPPRSVAQAFGGLVCPAKFALFVTTNGATSTNAAFAASGNQVTIKGEHLRFT